MRIATRQAGGWLVLRLLAADFRASLRNLRPRDRAWIVLGWGFLLANGAGTVAVWLYRSGEALRGSGGLEAGGVASLLVAGAIEGLVAARLVQSRAHAPFLAALPLAAADRAAMARRAGYTLGGIAALVHGLLALAAALLVGLPLPALYAFGATAVVFAAFAATLRLRLRRPWRAPRQRLASSAATVRPPSRIVAWLDRGRPAWLGSWALGFPGGRLRLGPVGAIVVGLIVLVGIGGAVAGFGRASSVPASAVGTIGGLLLFMATLRCAPLVSPVLRSSPLAYGQAWRRLMRLPLAVSLAFFAPMAGSALAAQPAGWEAPLAAGLNLFVLEAIYGVFAAFFATLPLAAAISFVLALALSLYETLEYGRTVVVGLLALLVFLWIRTRRRYELG